MLLCGININSYRSNTHNTICRLQRLQLRMIEFIHHKYLQHYTYDTMMRNIKFQIIIAWMLHPCTSPHLCCVYLVCVRGRVNRICTPFECFSLDYVRNAIFMHRSASACSRKMWQRFFKYYIQMNPIFHFNCMRTLCYMNEDHDAVCCFDFPSTACLCVRDCIRNYNL